GGPMSQISASAAMQKDGHFFETALLAWRKSLDEWSSYGNRELPTSVGFNILLNDKEKIDEQIAEAQRQLDRLCPGEREKIKEEKLAKLPADKRLALEMPAAQRTTEQYMLAYEAEQAIKVLPVDFNGRGRREDQPQIRKIIDQIEPTQLSST